MATKTVYCDVVTSAEFTDPENAQGEPSAGNAAPFASATIAGAGTATLTGSCPATAVPGTITGFSVGIAARALVASNTSIAATLSGLTFSLSANAPITNFAEQTLIASAFSAAAAATLKASIEAGLTGIGLAFASTLADTAEAKGMHVHVTYTPKGPIDGGIASAVSATRTTPLGIINP